MGPRMCIKGVLFHLRWDSGTSMSVGWLLQWCCARIACTGSIARFHEAAMTRESRGIQDIMHTPWRCGGVCGVRRPNVSGVGSPRGNGE